MTPGLSGTIGHTLRSFHTPNADPRGQIFVSCPSTNREVVLLNKADPEHGALADPEYHVNQYLSLLAKCGITEFRSNAVFAYEQVFHFSPEIVRGGSRTAPVDFIKALQLVRDVAAFVWEEFKETTLLCVGHLDETTAHVHNYVVPMEMKLVKPAGRLKKGARSTDRIPEAKYVLAARTMFTPKRLSQLQTLLADSLRRCGHDVERGIPGSRASFVTMAGHYKLIHSPTPQIPAFTLPAHLPALGQAFTDPAKFCQQVLAAANAWHHEVTEKVISPLHHKALEYDTAN